MTLDGLTSRTTVTFEAALPHDTLLLNGVQESGPALLRVQAFLEHVRALAHTRLHAAVCSDNNFPTGTGIASSAAAFAALALAASHAAGLDLDEPALSRLARLGSGSACRSIPGGFVEWRAGADDRDSYAVSIAPADHWHLVDCVAVISQVSKRVGSYEGHALADSSPLQAGRLAGAAGRLETCRSAILQRDFDALARVVELDSHLMHAVMMTSTPPLLYWQPPSLAVMQAVSAWCAAGDPVCFTLDAGPNVHVLTTAQASQEIAGRLAQIPGVESVLSAPPGRGAHLIAEAS